METKEEWLQRLQDEEQAEIERCFLADRGWWSGQEEKRRAMREDA